MQISNAEILRLPYAALVDTMCDLYVVSCPPASQRRKSLVYPGPVSSESWPAATAPPREVSGLQLRFSGQGASLRNYGPTAPRVSRRDSA